MTRLSVWRSGIFLMGIIPLNSGGITAEILTPPMGWNCWAAAVDADKVLRSASRPHASARWGRLASS
ncbi:MAG: hypothetical protein PHE83_01485 [Opitutaceae bacterium]|nr:hypothetical protein [Opitutaceae bacterium]